jgi:hypothetical protein
LQMSPRGQPRGTSRRHVQGISTQSCEGSRGLWGRLLRQPRFELAVNLQSLLLRVLPLPAPGRAFAETEWRTLACLAEALVPETVEMPSEDIADNVEKFLIRGRSRRAWRVRALMHLVEWSPLTVGRKPLSQMSLGERRDLVEERYIEGRGLWGICAKARYLVVMGAYGDRRLHAPTSYVPVSSRRRFARNALNGEGVVAT